MKYGIYFSHINKFTKQLIPIKKIRNNKEVKPKWMNGEMKRFIREAYHIQKNKFIRRKSSKV